MPGPENEVFRLHVTALDLKFTLLVPGHRKISDVKTEVTTAWSKYKATGLSIAHICNGEGFIQDPDYTVHSVFTQNDKVVVDGGEIKDGAAPSNGQSSASAADSAGGALKRKSDGQMKRPKRPPTAYKLWAKAEGAHLLANDKDVKLKDVWGDLDDGSKEPYMTRHQEATDAFNQKMGLFKAQNVDENGKRLKRQKKERDPNKPPPSAYNLYVQSESKRLEQENKIPKKDRFKTIANAWSSMDDTKKTVWHKKLAAAKTKYDQAQENTGPPAEEEEEDDDDNDDDDDDDGDGDGDGEGEGEGEGEGDDSDDDSNDDSDDEEEEEEAKAPPAPKTPPPKVVAPKADVKSEKKKNKKAKEPKVKDEEKTKKKSKKSGKSKKKEQSA